MSDFKNTPQKDNQAAALQAKMPEGEQLTNSFSPPSFSLSADPIQKKSANPPVQMKAGDLKTQMDRLFSECPVVNAAFMDTIHNATVAERQAILNDKKYIDAINNSIGGTTATVVISALMEGSQEWRNPTGNDFYAFFVTNNGNGPLPNTATMNCWESILYAAFLAGQLNAAWIKSFYGKALAAPDANAEIWKLLGFHTGLPEFPATTPTAGQLIFYYPKGATVPSHVALSQGGDLATSLWSQPNNVDSVQRISVNDLATAGGKIYIGNPSW